MKKFIIILIIIGGMGIAYFLLQAGPEEKEIRELLEQTGINIEKNDCAAIYETLADSFVVPELGLSKENFNRKSFPQLSEVKELNITKINVHDITENTAKASLIVKIVDATLGSYSTLDAQLEFVKINDTWLFILADVKPFNINIK